MKAVLLAGPGGPEKVHYTETADPVAGAGEVVVDVHAASINAADWKVRLGGHGYNVKFPHILGRDFSGIVSALGAGTVVNDVFKDASGKTGDQLLPSQFGKLFQHYPGCGEANTICTGDRTQLGQTAAPTVNCVSPIRATSQAAV